ncbi:hypothetical protein [Nonlabens sp.]|uniref:hypothetical protein n=1 Tax=Nonlabens sp. TaxID=1888209 RepID=UPI0039E2CFC9
MISIIRTLGLHIMIFTRGDLLELLKYKEPQTIGNMWCAYTSIRFVENPNFQTYQNASVKD